MGKKMNRPARLVLIVDDHADTREMYAMYLAAKGFATSSRATARRGSARHLALNLT